MEAAAEITGRGQSRKGLWGDSWASSISEGGRCSDLYFTKIMLMQRMDCRGTGWAAGRPPKQLLFLAR